MSIRLTRAVALAAVVSSFAGAALAADSDPVVAVVDGAPIHLSKLQEIKNSYQQLRQTPLETVYDKLLDQAITAQLVLEQAKKQKLETDPKVKEAFVDAQNQILENAWIQKKVESDVTDAKIKERYDRYVKEFVPEETVKVSHILLDTEDAAKQVIADLKTGISFEDEAKAKSKDPSASKNGGDLDYIKKGDVVPEFADAAFKLKPGEVTAAPVKTQFGWHVIKAGDRRMSSPESYDELKDRVRTAVAQDDLRQVLTGLQATAQIKRFKEDGSPADSAAPAAK